MEIERLRRNAEALVEKTMKGNDASHDAAHVWRVRDLALSLAKEEGLSSNPHSMEIVTFLISPRDSCPLFLSSIFFSSQSFKRKNVGLWFWSSLCALKYVQYLIT